MSFAYEIPSYEFSENPAVRGPSDNTFRWVEPAIPPDLDITTPGVFSDFDAGIPDTWTFYGTGGFLVSSEGTSVPYGDKARTNLYALEGTQSLCLSPDPITYIDGDTPILTGAWTGIAAPTGQEVAIKTDSLTAASGNEIVILFDAKLYGDLDFRVMPRNNSGEYYDFLADTWGSYSGALSGSLVKLVENDVRPYRLVFRASDKNPHDVVFRAYRKSSSAYVMLEDIQIGNMALDSSFGYTMPSEYYLQVTPDLGWGDIPAMFNERVSDGQINYQLFNYHVPSYIQNPDGTAQFSLPSSDMLEAFPGSGQYLWRIVPVSAGGTKGLGGLPERCAFIDTIHKTSFSVNPFVYSNSDIQQITGTRPKLATISATNLDSPEVLYPTPTTFRILFKFERSKYSTRITCTTSGGVSAYYKLDVEIPEQGRSMETVAAPQDSVGYMLQRRRLFAESNTAYQERLRNAFKWRTNVDKQGLVAGIATTLGLPVPTTALKLKSPADVDIAVTDYEIKLYSPRFVCTERIYLEPAFGYGVCTKYPERIVRATYHGQPVETTLDGYRIYFAKDYLDLTYQYVERLPFTTYATLADIPFPSDITVTFLNAGGSARSDGLLALARTRADGAELLWSPIVAANFLVADYRDAFLTETKDYWDTKYAAWVKRAIVSAFPTYGTVRFDTDYWDPPVQTVVGFEALPTLADSTFQRYSDGAAYYDEWSAWFLSYQGFNGRIGVQGITAQDIISGVGGKNDLRPGITETTFKYKTKFRRPLSHTNSAI